MGRIKKLLSVRFNFTNDTKIAFLLGFIVVGLSFFLRLFLAETAFNKAVFFIVLDIIIKVILGFLVPIQYVLVKQKKGVEFFGLTKKKWKLSLILGVVFMSLLLIQFLTESKDIGQKVLLRPEALIPITYIFVAGIFEMTFIYGFLRKIFEESFGIIPSIILTALFYSFHHAGFQPEFIKLIFVGIMYASVFRITNNILIIFPFFWGIGAVWDVLVNFGTAELEGLTTLYKALFTLALMIIVVIYTKLELKRVHKNCNSI